MDNYKIEIAGEIPKDIEEKMRKGFVDYERSHGIDINYKRFSFLLKDTQGTTFGILNAYTAFAEVYIDDLFVDESLRGKGYGKKLIQALEEFFKDKGFNNINLVTSAFQAPEFYKKCGFAIEFTRENKINPKLSKTFFIKYFKNKEQTQGLLHD